MNCFRDDSLKPSDDVNTYHTFSRPQAGAGTFGFTSMPAPKNNAYWKNRIAHGRRPAFETAEAFLNAWTEYFQWSDNNPWLKPEQLKKPYSEDKNGKKVWVTTIDIPTKRPYTYDAFCAFHGLGKHYLNDLEKRLLEKPDEDFSDILSWARGVCDADKLEGAMVGVYNGNIVARLMGLKESSEIKLTKVGKDLADETYE